MRGKMIIILLLSTTVLSLSSCKKTNNILTYNSKSTMAQTTEDETPVIYTGPGPVIQEETSISETIVDNSIVGQTEKEVMQDFENRGFSKQGIFTNYDGVRDCREITGSDEIHDSYNATYTSPNGNVWIIDSCGGNVTAHTTSFDMNPDSNNNFFIISEKEKIVNYDRDSNTFYQMENSAENVKIIIVDNLNAETLDNLTFDEISSLNIK